MNAVWKSGSRINTPAPVVLRVMEEITGRDGEVCTPEELVKAARPARSPIHDLFLWDNEHAGHLYRISQARHIVRCIVPVSDDGVEQQGPAFVSVTLMDGEGTRTGYMATDKVRADPQLYEQVVRKAYEQVSSLRRRHEFLKELQPIWRATDDVGEALAKKSRTRKART